ncbi:polysaccharide lyase family 8 super-sandwich domain-containing protein [uncultured Bacteroides sp.]|uniref:polysaccharide lyase family 8 super-sandwich domain-containing protein n=1 Tax=uncultured Bacteroides sp. TaxID=162156 RepID=UPI0025CE3FCC|nr:polysaccharide lyase family 8 super-sandwich domain-containing protein [uncultured Bacteroides sp.]
MKRLLLICLSLCFWGEYSYAVEKQKDIEILYNRLLGEYLSDSVDVSQAEKDLAVMQTDGSWKDIDYKTVTFYFDADRHLKRLRNIALAYSKPGNKLFHESELRKKIILGLDYFRITNPDSGNWWYRDIGAPSQYMVPLLLLKKELKREDLMRLSSYLVDKTDNVAHKGKNRTWVSVVLIHKGCIEDNYELIAKGFSSIASTIYVEEKDDEGMKRDNSIHQHRPQLYSGGYGMSLMSDLAEYITLANKTSFIKFFTLDKIKLVSDVFLKGTQMFGYREAYDFGTIGRGICRPNCLKNMSTHTLDLMQEVDPAHAKDYEAWKRHINGAAFPVPGNTHFWKSNIMTHHGSDYYMSAKIISVRTNGTEMLNGQNLKGYYLPLGATNIMTTGHEYDDVFVVWDWTRVPGTTAVANQSTAELRWYLFGSNQFGGGVSNAHNGVMAYEHAYQGVEARKAYFFMGDAMVCMGSSIKAARTQEVRTSVNQCLANGEVTYGLSGHAYRLTDNLSDKKIDWAYHDNIGYIFPQNESVTLRKAKQTGAWRELEVTASEKPVTKEVFSLWISHGNTPQHEDYCYIVVPDKPLSYFTDKKFENEIKIIANTEQIQAITDGNKRQYAAVFYEPGEIRFSDDLVVAVNKKVLLYMEEKDGQYEIAVADPLYKEESVHLSLNGMQMDIAFPSGDYFGSSVIKHIAKSIK